MEDVRTLSQPVTHLVHQDSGLFHASLVFEPFSDGKAGDFRYGALPRLGYYRQLLILLGRQLELDGDEGHKFISLCFSTEMMGVRISKLLRGIVS